MAESQPIDLAISGGVAYYTWKENTSVGTPKESGAIWTIDGSIGAAPFEKLPDLRLHGDAQLFFGRVGYDTFIQGTGTPVNTDTDYFGLKFEGGAGWRITYRETSVEPFLGLAYRIWWRDILTTSVATGYLEWYRTLYGRIGIQAKHTLKKGITLYTTFSLDPMLWAEEKVYLGETLTFENGRQAGWEIEGGARWNHLEATGYWQATRFGESNVVISPGCPNGCIQPKSDQDIIGFKVGYLF